jgi:hypothetical protein
LLQVEHHPLRQVKEEHGQTADHLKEEYEKLLQEWMVNLFINPLSTIATFW